MKHSLHALAKNPGFTAAAVLTLALGIGANVALFSAVKSVLLEPLPYRDPGSIAMIWSRWSEFPKTWVSIPEFHQYRERLQSFDDVALFQSFEVNITEGDAERVKASSVTTNLLDVLGATPVVGRGFVDGEGLEGSGEVALISHGLWQARFAGDAGVVGRELSINGRVRLIVGVMPRDFRLPLDFADGESSQVYLPLATGESTGAIPHAGGSHSYFAVGRLKPSVTEAAANAELATHVDRLEEEGVYGPAMEFGAFAVTVPNEVAGALRPALLLLFGAVVLVLLIACANVTGLGLARGERRRHEFGVRAALGADRGRLVRQVLAESLLIGGAGAIVGTWLAWLCVRVIMNNAPAGLARLADAAIDGPVLAFAVVVALAAAVVAGLIPALAAARTSPQVSLQADGRAQTPDRSRHALRRSMVTAQVALAIVLAAGAGLTLRSFWNVVNVDPGFEAAGLLTMRLAPNAAYFPDDAAVTGFYGELLRRVRAVPGVDDAGLVRLLPIDTEMGDTCVVVEGYVSPHGHCPPTEWQAATPGYFEAMGVRIVAGRPFGDADDRDAPLAAVVNEAFVRRYIPDRDPLGTRIRFAFRDDLPWHTIVGVVGDVRHNGVIAEPKPTFYRPHAQWAVPSGSPQRTMTLVIRTPQDPQALVAPVRAVAQAIDPRVPLSRVQTMEQVLGDAVAQPRFTLQLLGAFAVLALGLAVVGIYSIVAYNVAVRRRELGLRMALGATRYGLVRLSLREGLVYSALGAAIGLAAAFAGTRTLSGMLYGVGASDPATYVAVAVVVVAAALVASWVPASRASRVDPMTALRDE